MRTAPMLFVAVLLAAGCGTGGPGAVSETELDDLRRLKHGPLYWAGPTFGGLPLAHAESAGPDHAFFVYGDCDPPDGWFGDGGGCGPTSAARAT